MNKTDDILERLRRQQPSLDNPDEMTERIMDSLPEMEPAPRRRQMMITALRIVSTTAAVWLVGLFVYVHVPSPAHRIPKQEISYNNINALQRGSTLKDVYTRRQQEGKLKMLSYTQLRKKLYENK